MICLKQSQSSIKITQTKQIAQDRELQMIVDSIKGLCSFLDLKFKYFPRLYIKDKTTIFMTKTPGIMYIRVKGIASLSTKV